ncbi:MAG: hypothetical protein KME43_18030 [Myxacorys chilensis ATA2-1-KO14]|nr:hypothetical protein [Myxacorys chilensis ATA2-1-KO14]
MTEFNEIKPKHFGYNICNSQKQIGSECLQNPYGSDRIYGGKSKNKAVPFQILLIVNGESLEFLSLVLPAL